MAKRLNKLIRLLSEELETYYWIGYLLADGCISGNRLSLLSKDLFIIENFSKYINIDLGSIKTIVKESKKYYTLSIMDTENILKIKKKFDWHQNKTYNPPNLKTLTNENKIALSIGFIDGDGTIQYRHNKTSFHSTVRCHGSWFGFLEELYGNCSIDKRGYANAYITKSEDLVKMKKFALNHSLPILLRKWDRVDLNFVSKYTVTKQRRKIIIEELSKGRSNKSIAEELNISDAVVSLIRKDNFKKLRNEIIYPCKIELDNLLSYNPENGEFRKRLTDGTVNNKVLNYFHLRRVILTIKGKHYNAAKIAIIISFNREPNKVSFKDGDLKNISLENLFVEGWKNE